MTAITFTLKTPSKQRIDVSPLVPDLLIEKNFDEILGKTLNVGNRLKSVGDLFNVAGSNPEALEFHGSTAQLDFVGRGMTRGEIVVLGDAGSYVGMHLKGGVIRVNGSVDAYAACEMRAGTIYIEKNAGDFLGACLPGNKKGMAGGFVVVRGNVGHRVGDHMRRGAILIEGDAGDYLGSRMVSGTIGLLGKTGQNLGYAMGRGTLLLAKTPEQLPVTFNDCGTHTLGFIPLLLNGFSQVDTPFAAMAETFARVRRLSGDMCGLGKGEILLAIAH